MNDSFNNVFCGKGEFQLRDIHAVAEVEVSDGLIQKIEFTSGNGGAIEGANSMARMLTGQPVSQALEIKAEDVSQDGNRSEIVIKTALLEAFHRAIELYMDEQ